MRHVNATTNVKLMTRPNHHQHSTAIPITTTMSLDARTTANHLSDVDIRKILGLAKALVPQREFATFVGVWMGTERCTEEFGRFGTEECVLIGIFIHVS